MRNHLTTHLLGLLTLGLFTGVAAASITAPTGVWQLDGDLSEESAGTALTADGFAASFTTVNINGRQATVLELPQLVSPNRLQVTNDAGANGGGARLNDWTIVMDVRFDTIAGDERSLLRATTGSGDTDMWVTSAGGIDTNFTANMMENGAIPEDTWVRIAISRTAGADGLTAYVNGTPGEKVSGFGTDDGDFSLSATVFDLFSDNGAETSAAQVNSIALWDSVLTPTEVARLGNAFSGGIITTGLYGQNLIINPGAETDTGNGTGTNSVISGWEDGATTNESTADAVDTGFNTQTYAGNFSQNPGQLPSEGGSFGDNYLYASETAGDGSIGQTIDVSAIAGEIDKGRVTFDAEGYFGGFNSADPGSLILQFLDGSDVQIGGDVTIGGVAIARIMTFDSTSSILPDGTRSIRAIFFADNTAGANDGAADNLSLVLAHIPTPAALPAGLVMLALAGLRRRRNK